MAKNNNHNQSIDKTELVWPGKRKEVERVELPFQTIETINLPRGTRQEELFGGKEDGWKNRLIWGDNLLIMGSLLKEFAGKINLIYIDPPFATGDDFSFTVQIGDQAEVTKEPSALEVKAYRDTWGKGMQSYLQMMHDRLVLMKELLADDGSIYVHLDWHVGHYVKLIMDEIFGRENFVNEIIWHYEGPQSPSPIKLASKHDTIFRYAVDINKLRTNEDKLWYEHEIDKTYSTLKKDEKGYFRIQGLGDYSDQSIARLEKEGRIYVTSKGTKYLKHYIEEKDGKLIKPKKLSDVWSDIAQLGTAIQKEKVNYSTQKPEKLLKRIIEIDTKEGDLVADFFCGSGTTGVVAEKLGRRWIMSDLGRFAIHTTRKAGPGYGRQTVCGAKPG